jgi:hypothetical protein
MFRIPIAPQLASRLVACSALVGVLNFALATQGLARPMPTPAPQAQTWDPHFANGETNGVVRAYANYNGQLYAGGDFTVIDGTSANYVARWNGSNWEALTGEQLPNPVTALAVFNGVLYAGGVFQPWAPGCEQQTPSGPGVQCANLLREGYLIAALGVGGWTLDTTRAFAVSVRDLEVFSDAVQGTALYVGGNIASVGAVDNSPHLLRYSVGTGTGTGASGVWSGVGYGVDPDVDPFAPANGVYDLLSVKSETLTGFSHDVLCVAGKFGYANSLYPTTGTRNIAHWSHQGWHDIGCGMQSAGFGVPPAGTALAVFRKELYVGGSFSLIGCGAAPVPVNNLAVWNGATWRRVGGGFGAPNGVDAAVSSMTVLPPPGTLVIGGAFGSAGPLVANGIARWNGTAFLPVGGGVENGGYVGEVHAGPYGLSIGGAFNSVLNTQGGVPVVSNLAALWYP